MKKRLLSLLAAFCLVVTLVPAPVRADGGAAALDGPDDQTLSELDQRVDSLQPAEGGKKVDVDSVKIDKGVYEIKLSGTAAPSDSDAAPGLAYWVGVGIAAPEGYTSAYYTAGDLSINEDLVFIKNNGDGTLDDIQKGDTVKGFALWFDAETVDPDGIYYTLKWSADGKPDRCEVYRFIWAGTPNLSARIDSLEPAEGGKKVDVDSVKIDKGVYKIKLTGAATPSTNPANVSAYWVGVGIAAPGGYTSVSYAKGDYSTDKDLVFKPNNDKGTLDDIQKGDTVKGFALWFDAETVDPDGIYYTLKWFGGEKDDRFEVYRFIWAGTPNSGAGGKDPNDPPAAYYKITIAPGIEHGSVTANKDYAAAGDTVTLTVTPDKGYQLRELTVTPSTVDITNNAFTMPGSDVTIGAVFEPAPLTGSVVIEGMPRSGETLTVSVADSNNTGTLSYRWYASGADIAGATGTTYTLTDAEIGKKITCTVKSDKQTGSITSQETAPVVDKDTELTAYKVTFDMNGHGTAPKEQNVYAGGKAAKPVDPTASGWIFGGWFKDSGCTEEFDFKSEITADTVIYAKWTKDPSSGDDSATYKITVASADNGTVTADKTTAKKDETVTLTITPNSGYSLGAISTTPTLTLSGSGNTRTFAMPASDVTVSATFAANSAGTALTGTVVIYGNPWVGETLEARVRNTNNTGTLYYQWTASGVYISGATSSTFRLTRYQVGKVIRCIVTSSVQTGSITGYLWDTVDYDDSRYYPPEDSTSNHTSTGTNQSGSAETENGFTIDTPLFTTATNADGTKTTTIIEPDGSSGLVVLTSYGTVSSASMTFSSSAFASALRTGSALTLPAAVQAARSADSAAPVRIVLPQATGSVKIRIPVSQMTAGTVAVTENYFGPDTVVRSSVSESNGVLFELTGSAVVKIVDNSRSFSDVSAGAWYANAVNWAASREVMTGVSARMFDPQGTVTRAMMAQMLYNFAGANDTAVVSQFSDVSSGDWYAASVSWAARNGIAGNGMDRFGAEDALTRENMATMLYNYARAKGYTPYASSTLAFSDAGDVSDWARTAMQWAVSVGLVSGTQNGTKAVVLDPQGTVTRAQLATVMQRFNNLY